MGEKEIKIIPKKIIKPIKTKPKIAKKIEKPKAKEIKPALKPEIRQSIDKIGVSKIETKEPKITPEELWQPVEEIGKEKIEDKFHDLIEEEISLLKQKRIDEAKNIHFQIKDMLSSIIDPDQRKIIIRDWNRIKGLY